MRVYMSECVYMSKYVQLPVFVHLSVCMCVCEPLEVGQETQLRTSAGTTNILNCSDISSAQYSPLYI